MIIFLSYAKEDSARVGQIYKDLKEAGYQPWMDNHDISPGQDWKIEIQNAISLCDAAIIFLSSRSVSKAGYVQVELAEFLEQRKRRPEGSIYLIPVRLDPCVVPARMSDLHYADLFEADGWVRVIASLEKAQREQSLLREQGETRATFTVFTRVMDEQWDGLPGYSARLSYPELRGGATAEACEELNQVLKARCLSTLHELRSNIGSQNPSLWENIKNMAIYRTIKEYKITYISDVALSIVSTVYRYTGGAHGNFHFFTDNFTLQPVSRLPLSAFFKLDCDYREVLGALSREALKRQAWDHSLSNTFDTNEFSKKWLIDGTTFKDNMKVDFTFAESGMTLYFPPYQVAAFAAGSWEVTLPYYDLREILRPNGLHRKFIPSS